MTDPGNGASLTLQDRAFHDWSTAVAVDYEHRFRLDDVDLGMVATHALYTHGAYAGFSLGGAPHGVLLPTARASLLGGWPLGHGLLAEAEVLYRHYSNANIYTFSPTASFSRFAWTLSAGYGLSSTRYTTGATSGGLSSYRVRLAYDRYCRLRPWWGYARSKEAFESGQAGARNFLATHYLGGATLWLWGGWSMQASMDYEDRPDLVQHIRHYGVGLTYEWGNMP